MCSFCSIKSHLIMDKLILFKLTSFILNHFRCEHNSRFFIMGCNPKLCDLKSLLVICYSRQNVFIFTCIFYVCNFILFMILLFLCFRLRFLLVARESYFLFGCDVPFWYFYVMCYMCDDNESCKH
jgi:hypothetical protein